jgi:hypothetical protein
VVILEMIKKVQLLKVMLANYSFSTFFNQTAVLADKRLALAFCGSFCKAIKSIS